MTNPADVAIRARPEQLAKIDEIKRIYGLNSLHEAIQVVLDRYKAREKYNERKQK